MKKFLTIVSIVLVLVCAVCLFTACKDEAYIQGYTIENKTYTVGDTYASSDVAITATLSDDSTKTISENLIFVGDGEEDLNLNDDGCFTKTGSYSVKVYALEEREDLFIGTWTIVVED